MGGEKRRGEGRSVKKGGRGEKDEEAIGEGEEERERAKKHK